MIVLFSLPDLALTTKFSVDYENDFVEVSVNEPFMHLLNDLRLNYTSIVE